MTATVNRLSQLAITHWVALNGHRGQSWTRFSGASSAAKGRHRPTRCSTVTAVYPLQYRRVTVGEGSIGALGGPSCSAISANAAASPCTIGSTTGVPTSVRGTLSPLQRLELIWRRALGSTWNPDTISLQLVLDVGNDLMY